MYCVFWIGYVGEAECQFYDDLGDAISACAMLRQDGRSFVTMAVEDSNMVGKMGVDEVGPDYDWVKRRDAISVRKKDL